MDSKHIRTNRVQFRRFQLERTGQMKGNHNFPIATTYTS